MGISRAPLNMRAFMEDYLEAFDITDKDRYFAEAPQAPPGLVPQAEPGSNGVTNPELAAGILAPSNQTTMSPAGAMQQALTQTGPVS